MNQNPSFDFWTIVFGIAAAQGLFVAFVLWRWDRGHRLGNRLLAVLLGLFSVTMIDYVLFWTGFIVHWPHMADVSAHFPFLFGPILWFYFRSSFERRPLKRADWLHVLPFLLAVVSYLPWYILPAIEKYKIYAQEATFPVPLPILRVLMWGRLAHLTVYAAWNLWYIRRQPAIGSVKRWAWWLAGLFIGFVIAYCSYFLLFFFVKLPRSWDYHVSAFMLAFIYLIAHAGYMRPRVFDGFNIGEAAAPIKYRHSGLTVEAGRSLLEKLEQVMGEEKLYCDADLSLDALAARLDVSKHHLSQIINEHLGLNFFEYLNALRVEEAKRLLAGKNPAELNIIEAAYSAGFNTRGAFNSAFKRATGDTPGAFRKKHRASSGAAANREGESA
jgi:AraC-like DNA-binding protein